MLRRSAAKRLLKVRGRSWVGRLDDTRSNFAVQMINRYSRPIVLS